MTTAETMVEIRVTEEHYPRYDAAHGTPDPMARRLLTLKAPKGGARFEQTDYGHPGRFNAWEPRGIDAGLQARTNELRAVCEALAPLLR
ncbi:MAG: hypothetical protein AAB349_00255 [Chloroflexota bacterium]